MLGKNSEKLPFEVERNISTYLTVQDLFSLRGVSKKHKKTIGQVIVEEQASQLSYNEVSLINQDMQQEITFNLMRLITNCNKINPHIKSDIIKNFIGNIKIYREGNILLSLTYITKLIELAEQKLNNKLTTTEIANFNLWQNHQFNPVNWRKIIKCGSCAVTLYGIVSLCVTIPLEVYDFYILLRSGASKDFNATSELLFGFELCATILSCTIGATAAVFGIFVQLMFDCMPRPFSDRMHYEQLSYATRNLANAIFADETITSSEGDSEQGGTEIVIEEEPGSNETMPLIKK